MGRRGEECGACEGTSTPRTLVDPSVVNAAPAWAISNVCAACSGAKREARAGCRRRSGQTRRGGRRRNKSNQHVRAEATRGVDKECGGQHLACDLAFPFVIFFQPRVSFVRGARERARRAPVRFCNVTTHCSGLRAAMQRCRELSRLLSRCAPPASASASPPAWPLSFRSLSLSSAAQQARASAAPAAAALARAASVQEAAPAVETRPWKLPRSPRPVELPLEAVSLGERPLTAESRRCGVVAVKCGMTCDWTEWGERVPLTVAWLDDCQVCAPSAQQQSARCPPFPSRRRLINPTPAPPPTRWCR